MTGLAALLVAQPLLILALAIGLGSAMGQISVAGFALGVGAVLFVGLGLGALAPGAQVPALVGTIGLILFLYGIGIQYGTDFFKGLRSDYGRRANLLALAGLACGTLAVLLVITVLGVDTRYAAGMFAGAMTSTAALQAALQASGSNDPAIGYGVSYPFGVLGPILCLYAFFRIVRPEAAGTGPMGLRLDEVVLRNPALVGITVAQLMQQLPAGVQIASIRKAHHNHHPGPELTVAADDVLLLVASAPAELAQAQALIGEHAPGRLMRDRTDLDYLRVFASKPAVIGRTLGELRLPEGARIVHVRRGDHDLMPSDGMRLEWGDRVGMLVPRKQFGALRRFFGDSIRGTAELSYAAAGLGMALGIVVGLVPVPVPGLGTVSLGVAGGPLIVALILGRLGRTGSLVWSMPISANLTLRNFGLTIFLASVGINSGHQFVTTVAETGLFFLLVGAFILLAVVLPILLVGHFLMRMKADDLFGIVSGATGNPAIPAYANRLTPSDRIDIGYATIFPGTTIVKILIVQIVLAVAG